MFLRLLVTSFFICLLVACRNEVPNREPVARTKKEVERDVVQQLISAEDLILDLTPKLHQLANSLKAVGHFNLAKAKTVTGLNPGLESIEKATSNDEIAGIAKGEIESVNFATASNSDPWMSFNKQLNSWETAKFGIKSGGFIGGKNQAFEMQTVFSGRCKSNSNSTIGVKSKQQIRFEKDNAKQWQIASWKQKSFEITQASSPLFENVTSIAIPDSRTRQSVTRSFHEEYLINVIKTGVTPVYDQKYLPFADADMNHATPSVSVVDLNEDGWDDLFITARWGPPVYLQNMADGTYADKTKDIGIIGRGLVNCSAFVDIDNDGDKDVILGRAMEPVVVMENQNGRFRDVTAKKSNLNRLFFVSAISASDINRDGLVDFYLSTYGPAGDNRGVDWKRIFLPPKQAKILAAKERSDHMWVDFPGPPNVVVMNRGGGKLEQVPVDSLASQWHNSFQSAWGDFDLDGDDDLYVCNDFAPGGFLINETPVGAENPVFKDGIPVAFPAGTMGFGMGTSWSDFDADGDLDLYISNMYSKAGKRILSQLTNNDSRFEVSASGNYLYQNNDGTFKQIAGDGTNEMPVNRVGWSYGGQFADFNNDGYSDLYVPSGFFTAPDLGETNVDL